MLSRITIAGCLLSPEVRDEGCDAQHRRAGTRLAARNGGESKQGMLPFNSISSLIRVLLLKKRSKLFHKSGVLACFSLTSTCCCTFS